MNRDEYRSTYFRTERSAAARLVDRILAGAMRGATGPMFFFENERFEHMPEIGEHVVLTDGEGCPLLIWRTTNLSVAPLSSVTEQFVWREGIGDGDRAEWLRLQRTEYARQGRIYGFETHDDIETVFVSFEVVWPDEVARRIRLITPQFDRSIALLQRLNEQRAAVDGLEAVFSHLDTAIFTTTPDLELGLFAIRRPRRCFGARMVY